MTTAASNSSRSSIERFYQLLHAGYDAWFEAGRIVAAELERDHQFAQRVHEAHAEISVSVVLAFDRIGRRVLHPKLAMSDSAGSIALRRLSYDVQSQYVDEMLDVIVWRNGVQTVERRRVFDLDKAQARQVFGRDRVRSESEQREWLNNKACLRQARTDQHSKKAVVVTAAAHRVIARYAVRKSVSGIAFERTNANTTMKQTVVLSDGMALVEIVEHLKARQ